MRRFIIAVNILLLVSIVFLLTSIYSGSLLDNEDLRFEVFIERITDVNLQGSLSYALGSDTHERDEPRKFSSINTNNNELSVYNLYEENYEFSNLDKMIRHDGIWLRPIYSTADGYVIVTGKSEREKIVAIIEAEVDAERQVYHLDLDEDGFFYQKIYFREGTGEYKVSVLYNTEGNKYRVAHRFEVTNQREMNRYLVPVQDVHSENEEIILKAEKIVEGKSNDYKKIKAVYNWVVNNTEYDYDKRDRMQDGDYSDNFGSLHMLQTRTGVCHDYATLTAALLRSIGIPTQVVVGEIDINGELIRHAWNRAYNIESDRWIVFDTTFASTGRRDYFDKEELNERPEEKVY